MSDVTEQEIENRLNKSAELEMFLAELISLDRATHGVTSRHPSARHHAQLMWRALARAENYLLEYDERTREEQDKLREDDQK